MASLQDHIPFLRYKTRISRTWATAGLTDAVTDADARLNSNILIEHTSAYDGRWRVTVAAGSFTVTSSDPEAATVTYSYVIL